MTISNKHSYTLRNKMLLFIGGFISLIVIGISIATLFKWKEMIIEKKNENAKSLTYALSVSILQGFLYGENDDIQPENLFETIIANFSRNLKDIKYVSIIDINHRIIAHSDPSKFSKIAGDSVLFTDKSENPVTSIYKNNEYGWILESAFTIRIANKKWGVLRIAFDAEPIRTEIRNAFLILLFLTIFVISVIYAILFFISSRLTYSLHKLVEVMDITDWESMETIDLPIRNDETGFLITHFQQLRMRLLQSKHQVINAQKQIYHAEKLASIGRLASGVAHEINNPLNGIKSCIYSIQKEPLNIEQTEEYLKLIDEGLIYIETVVQKLLGFARQQPIISEHVNMRDIIGGVTSLLHYKLNQKDVKLILNLNDNLPGIKVNLQLLQEVLMNLVLNSFDAVDKSGVIEISTSRINNHFTLSVKDNGVGIKSEEMKHIFEPFYTTKEPGVGTGLGLSVSLGIVEAMGGKIVVDSIPNKETIFQVIFPIEETQ